MSTSLTPDDSPGGPSGIRPDDGSRRSFMKQAGGILGLALTPPLVSQAERLTAYSKTVEGVSEMTLRVNGTTRTLRAEPRVTLLDALRENLNLTGSKKGCDHGQCGACTVLVDGRRINSCLTLAVMNQGKEITTIEGLAKGEELHPMQAAFVKHDGFQCGYCTPGQIMSGVACVKEGHATNDAQTREWMSGNLCRCGAYPNIVAAVREVAGKV
ncbi:(2Fe-2S)-binding protein [Hymenobacter volaticus]|uniref:2Fe-2S iron-sulfur cluster-binding protein n=1 Tax=Hymenobacter volaticus TaxID=2932254 RepID=A0ABY4GA25_9BACT|nr:2Fe-2S iron-sulfur cluster-binding protein [Hymenobacter volaticus]UOQ67753.1 2Fe-2S iron-sulfur cluster-binding protein [Hymenobacter volaticus]